MNTCNQWWLDDDEQLQFCSLEAGHSGECQTDAGWFYSETVILV